MARVNVKSCPQLNSKTPGNDFNSVNFESINGALSANCFWTRNCQIFINGSYPLDMENGDVGCTRTICVTGIWEKKRRDAHCPSHVLLLQNLHFIASNALVFVMESHFFAQKQGVSLPLNPLKLAQQGYKEQFPVYRFASVYRASIIIGILQRRLAWPLCKDD